MIDDLSKYGVAYPELCIDMRPRFYSTRNREQVCIGSYLVLSVPLSETQLIYH